jgi:FAD/FMN-containing dehydrogenase
MGLIVPVAGHPTVGVGGMTTGGGDGWFGEFGLSIDNLLSAEIVTADGNIRRIDTSNEADLFWAVRGGGANFGVLTSLEFQAHPLPELMFGMQVYPLNVGSEVGMKWRAHCVSAAPDFTSICAFARKRGPALMLLSKTGRPVVEAQVEFDKLRALGPSLKEMIKPVTSVELGLVGAADSESGLRGFAYSHYLLDLSPQVFDLCTTAIASAPSPDSAILIATMSTGVSQIPVDATPFPHRGQRFSFIVQSGWRDEADDQKNTQWVKDLWQAVLPFATGGVYSNYVSDTRVGTAKRAYAGNYGRLAQIKRRYDPNNLFNSTINIDPA